MFIHVVIPGETLWQIADRYHVALTEMVRINALQSPNQLLVGQALLIPAEDVVYTVQYGDTLWEIANSFGTTIASIVENNRIPNPDSIRAGMVLLIPAHRYRVQPGDTLWKIAQKYEIGLPTLIKINRIDDPNRIIPGMILVIPPQTKPSVRVNGYIYFLGEAAVAILSATGNYLTYLSPFAYLIKEDGTLRTIDDIPAIRAAQAQGALPMMAITNFTATVRGENLASIVLNSPPIIDRLLSEIILIMNEKGYRGVNIDFENVLPADREAYNRFLERAVNRLHAEGYFVSTAVAPKTTAQQVGLLYEAHDYAAHGRIVDFVILMTYEWGYRKGPPRAISPIDQIRRVLDYAITVIPRDKIFLGFQIYARDWLLPHVEGQEAETFSCQEAIKRAVQYGARIQYDPAAQSPFFRYADATGQRHEVWFEDARSAQAKFDTAKRYGLAGISYWALGYPFPQNWVLLADTFEIEQLSQESG